MITIMNHRRWVSFLLTILFILIHSQANENETISNEIKPIFLVNRFSQWRQTQIAIQQGNQNPRGHTIFAGLLCFTAAAIASAGGIGGGGLFVPILNVIAGLDLKSATSFSAFMVTGGTLSSVIYSLCVRNPKFGGKSSIDYDIALIFEPCMLLGVSIGVICNVIFPEWLITILFAVFLALTTLKTFKAGVSIWKSETDTLRRNGINASDQRVMKDVNTGESEGENNLEMQLLNGDHNSDFGFPWKKLGMLVTIWFSFLIFHVVLGAKNNQGFIQVQPCGIGFWTISVFQIPLALTFTGWLIHQKRSTNDQTNPMISLENQHGSTSSMLMFPIVALSTGLLGGFFGTGGGMVITPIFLQLGLPPEVTAATSSFIVLFSSLMSAAQYLLLGMRQVYEALILGIGCSLASTLGLVLVQRAVLQYGRASPIIFSISIVMALSTIMIVSVGGLHIWSNYTNGEYMGFKLPC